MRLLLDAGALIAVDRGARSLARKVAVASGTEHDFVCHGGIVGQVWRGDPRQVQLTRFLRLVDVVGLDEGLGRAAGALLARTRGVADVIDAALVALAHEGDTILTSDVDDIARLARAAPVDVSIVRV